MARKGREDSKKVSKLSPLILQSLANLSQRLHKTQPMPCKPMNLIQMPQETVLWILKDQRTSKEIASNCSELNEMQDKQCSSRLRNLEKISGWSLRMIGKRG